MPTPKPGIYAHPAQRGAEFFQGKETSFDYRAVWREEHALGFTGAKAVQLDVLRTIRNALISLGGRADVPHFSKKPHPHPAEKRLVGCEAEKRPQNHLGGARKKWVRLGNSRCLHTLFWANARTAYAAGQWERSERNQATHPYLIYELGPSKEHRLQHARWNGLILKADDAWWGAHMPPNGWGCKCRVRALSKAQSARRGGAGKAPPTKTRPWLNKRTGQTGCTGQTGRIPLGIDPGWDTNPGKVRRWVLTKRGWARRWLSKPKPGTARNITFPPFMESRGLVPLRGVGQRPTNPW